MTFSRTQCYDAYGNARVSPPSIAIKLTMGSLSVNSFSLDMSGNTRIFTAALPPSWFATASASGAAVEVASQLYGQPSQWSSLQVMRSTSPAHHLSAAAVDVWPIPF